MAPFSSSLRPLLDNPSEPHNFNRLIEETYQPLHRLAVQLLAGERPTPSLQPTVLLHEFYLRWKASPPKPFENLSHYFRLAGHQMRQVVIDLARRRRAEKRGDGLALLCLDEVEVAGASPLEDLVLKDLIRQMREFDPYGAQIAELRIVEGRDWAEVAAILGRGQSTVRRDWTAPRAWLQAAWMKQQ